MQLISSVKILIGLSFFLLGIALPYNSNKEEKFIAICKALATIEDIYYCEYENQKTMFILSRTEFISDPNKKINIKLDSLNLSIWFKKDLFMENIPYWYEFKEISEQGKNITIKLRSYNSINSQEKKPIIQGEIILKLNKQGYTVLNRNLVVVP